MNINKITITIIAVILTVFTLGVTAESGNKENADKAAHEHKKDKLDKHQVADSQKQSGGSNDHRDDGDRDKNEHSDNNDWDVKEYRESHVNENSNRQSDSDSTHGQERAAERHSVNADKHDRSDREPHWYDFANGKDRVNANQDSSDDLVEKKPRWWWPFN